MLLIIGSGYAGYGDGTKLYRPSFMKRAGLYTIT